MITNLGVYKLLIDLARVPLTDTNTLKIKVSKKLYNDPSYLIFTLISNGVYNISEEELIIGRMGDKICFEENKNIFLRKSEDMKELINEQRYTK